MVGIIQKLHSHQKDLLSNAVTFSVNWCKYPILVRYNSANGYILDRLFPNLKSGKSPKSIWRIWWALFRSNPPKRFALHMQCFFCKLVQMSNFGRLKSQNGHFLYYFQIKGKSLTSILRVWWPLIRIHQVLLSAFAVQYIFCKLVQIFVGSILQLSTFWRDYFQMVRQTPNIHLWEHYLEAPLPLQRFALQCSAFSVNWCKFPILVG